MTKNFPVDLMLEQPAGWLRASLPKIQSATGSVGELISQRSVSLSEAQAEYHKRRWFELTGTELSDTHFSIIIPIHNERRSLSSFLGALLASELPSSADIQIVFVVNASSDQSAELIMNRLACIHPPAEMTLPQSVFDKNCERAAFEVCHANIRFLVVETPTAGKANALNLGNEIARQRFHAIAINIDANNWVEPDSIALMFRKAKQSFVDSADSTAVIINASEYCQPRNTQMQVSVKIKTQKAEVSGCMFAWSTQSIHENNGFIQQAIEDYGMGLLALSQRKQILESEASIWVYTAGTPSDENRELVRFLYGAMQLTRRFENDPIAMQILLDDFPHLRPLRGRMEVFLSSRLKANQPLLIARGILKWLFNEFLIFKARKMLRKNPDGQTWEPIKSTK